jgi:hypothetical protein
VIKKMIDISISTGANSFKVVPVSSDAVRRAFLSERQGGYLIAFPGKLEGERCSCKSTAAPTGCWVVRHPTGAHFCFSPNTQVQKDVWLDARAEEYEFRLALLRWYCFHCGTVQVP